MESTTPEPDAELTALRDDYGVAYHIWHYDSQPWSALPKRGPVSDPIKADTARDLRAMLAADCQPRPRPTDQGSL